MVCCVLLRESTRYSNLQAVIKVLSPKGDFLHTNMGSKSKFTLNTNTGTYMRRINSIYRVSIISCFFFYFFSINNTVFAKTVELAEAIRILRIKEKTVDSISWECVTNRHQSDEGGNLVAINEPPLPSHAAVYVDAKGRYIVKTSIKVQSSKEVLDTEYITISTFDGKAKRSERTSVSPKGNRIDGYIYPENRNDLDPVNWNLYPEGIGFVFPYFAWTTGALDGRTKFLSDYLEYIHSLNRKITIDEDYNGLWTITVPDFVDQQAKVTVCVQIKYDPAKGRSGAVVSVRKCDLDVIDAPDKGAMTTYELQKSGEFFVPKAIKQEQLMGPGKPSRYTVLEYKNVKVNEPIPENAFEIDWKKNTAMVDYVAGQNYLISDAPGDEAQAVRDFMSLEGISRPPTIQNRSPISLYFRIALVVFGLSLIAYVIYSFFRKKNAS